MSESEFKTSTSIKVFINKIDCMLTIRDGATVEEVSNHLDVVKLAIDKAMSLGATATASGEVLADDEQEREVIQYVVCQYSSGLGVKLCSHKFPFCVVYDNEWSKLWFEPDTSHVFPSTSFQLETVPKDYIKQLPEPAFAIRKWTGKTKLIDGKEQKIWRFDRIANKGGQGSAVQSDSNTQVQPEKTPDQLASEIEQYIKTITPDRQQLFEQVESRINDLKMKLGPELHMRCLRASLDKRNELDSQMSGVFSG